MFEIKICPIKRLYKYVEDADLSDVAVLAVSSYDIVRDKLDSFGYILCLNFADTISVAHSSAFTKETAEKIGNYVKGLPDELDTLFVCCDSGESRSTAMAAAIMRYAGMNEFAVWQNPHYHPNILVYELLCDALGVSVTAVELQERKWMSEKALYDAINQN